MANVLAIGGLIMVVIFVIIATGFGGSVVDTTYTGACDIGTANLSACPLENASGTSKVMYGSIEFLYPVIIIITMLTAGFALGKKL